MAPLGAYGSFFVFRSYRARAKAIAGYGVMSSMRQPYGCQNSHIPLGDMQKNSKHCLVVPRGQKSYIFPA